MSRIKLNEFQIEISENVALHLAHIERKYWSLIRARIHDLLRFEPTQENRNRKKIYPEIQDSDYELRIGPQNRFRVFYKPIAMARIVRVKAIGIKIRNRLFIAGEEIT